LGVDALLAGFAATLSMVLSGSAAQSAPRARAVRAIGGGRSAVLDLHEGSALTPALSPDGRTIVLNFLGNLWTLPVRGGRATRISGLMHDTAYPTWSPDGRTIAFQSYKSGTFHIWAMNPDGSSVRELTFGFYDDREPVFSPDGSEIAVSSDRPPAGSPAGVAWGSYNIWTLI
jgi:Tol biopolymer transport system component